MTRIKIEDLPIVELLDAAETSAVQGGASYRFQPSYRPSPVYRPPAYNPGNFYNRPNGLISHNRGW